MLLNSVHSLKLFGGDCHCHVFPWHELCRGLQHDNPFLHFCVVYSLRGDSVASWLGTVHITEAMLFGQIQQESWYESGLYEDSNVWVVRKFERDFDHFGGSSETCWNWKYKPKMLFQWYNIQIKQQNLLLSLIAVVVVIWFVSLVVVSRSVAVVIFLQ